jgi:hypothetical protein
LKTKKNDINLQDTDGEAREEEAAAEEEGDEIVFNKGGKEQGKYVSLCLSARTALFLPYKVCSSSYLYHLYLVALTL